MGQFWSALRGVRTPAPTRADTRADTPAPTLAATSAATPAPTYADYPRPVVGCLEQLRDVDIIVNSTDKSLQLSFGGKISNVINDIGGPKIQEELNRVYPNGIQPGEVAVTSGYNLPYSYVYHCTLQDIKEQSIDLTIREIISECLKKAKDQFPNPSIAFPVIGTGAMEFTEKILRIMYCTILEFLEENPGSLKAAYIIIHPSRGDLIDYMKKLDPTEEPERL